MAGERIQLQDSMMDIVMKMSEGNPGAVNVLCQILQNGERIDPDTAIGSVMPILSLDTHGIYSSKIWMFYKDVCGQSINRTLGVLRAIQLGFVGESTVKDAIEGKSKLPVDDLLKKVKERLPHFVLDETPNA